MPTPTAHESKGTVTEKTMNRHSLDLTNYVAVYPTPGTSTMGGCSGNRKKVMNNPNLTAEEKRSMCAGNGGRLNPDWVEWLMGWQIGWTKLQPGNFGMCKSTGCQDSQSNATTGGNG